MIVVFGPHRFNVPADVDEVRLEDGETDLGSWFLKLRFVRGGKEIGQAEVDGWIEGPEGARRDETALGRGEPVVKLF